MKRQPVKPKTSQPSVGAKTTASAGPGGVTVSPPNYGIGFLDHATTGLAIQPRSLVTAPEPFNFKPYPSATKNGNIIPIQRCKIDKEKLGKLKHKEIESLEKVSDDNKLGKLLIEVSMEKDTQKEANNFIANVLDLFQKNDKSVPEWKNEIVKNDGLRAVIREYWKDEDAAVIMGLFLEGALQWQGSGTIYGKENKIDIEGMKEVGENGSTEFMAGMFGGKIDNIKIMNCWESVLYSAYMAGILTREDLSNLNALACANWEKASSEGDSDASDGYIGTLTRFLGQDEKETKVWDKKSEIPRGSIVFFTCKEDDEEDPQGHIALSLGMQGADKSPMILSLNNSKKESSYNHLTINECEKGIKKLGCGVTEIKYAPISWEGRKAWLKEELKRSEKK